MLIKAMNSCKQPCWLLIQWGFKDHLRVQFQTSYPLYPICQLLMTPLSHRGQIPMFLEWIPMWVSDIINPQFSQQKSQLVGGLEHEFYFSIQLGMSSSQLTFIFFRGVETTTQPIFSPLKLIKSTNSSPFKFSKHPHELITDITSLLCKLRPLVVMFINISYQQSAIPSGKLT